MSQMRAFVATNAVCTRNIVHWLQQSRGKPGCQGRIPGTLVRCPSGSFHDPWMTHMISRSWDPYSIAKVFFPTSQVRVVRFYHSCSSPPSPLPPPSQSSSPTSSPILIAKLLENPLRQLLIAVGTAGPQLPASDRSGHPWTSTASVVSQWAPLDLNRQLPISVGTPGPQRPDFITKHYHKASSQYIITKHHHRPSSQIIITDHLHKTSSEYIITKHHHKSLSQIIFTTHHHNTSSQSIITNHYHRSFSQSIIATHHQKASSQNIITQHHHKASSQSIITIHEWPSSGAEVSQEAYWQTKKHTVLKLLKVVKAVTCHYKTTSRNSSNTMLKCHGGDHSK